MNASMVSSDVYVELRLLKSHLIYVIAEWMIYLFNISNGRNHYSSTDAAEAHRIWMSVRVGFTYGCASPLGAYGGLLEHLSHQVYLMLFGISSAVLKSPRRHLVACRPIKRVGGCVLLH